MLKCFKLFRGDESGATAIEYGLIAALVSDRHWRPDHHG